MKSKAIVEMSKNVLKTEAIALNKTADGLGEEYQKFVEEIAACKGNLIIMGMGKSGIIAQKLSSTLIFIGYPALFINAADALHGDIGLVKESDVVVLISYGGETREIIELLPYIKAHSKRILLMTSKKKSTLGKCADALLDISVEKEADCYNLIPSTSTTVTTALGDAIVMSLMEIKNITIKDLLSRHMGGAIGKRKA